MRIFASLMRGKWMLLYGPNCSEQRACQSDRQTDYPYASTCCLERFADAWRQLCKRLQLIALAPEGLFEIVCARVFNYKPQQTISITARERNCP